MKRKGNIVLSMQPEDPSIFGKLELVSQASALAGLGRLLFVRDLFIDVQSARYEFLLETEKAWLSVHDDFDLGFRYISVGGDPTTADGLIELTLASIANYSLDALLRFVEKNAAVRPEWLNALALASGSPASDRVVRIVSQYLRSPDERVCLRAVEAAFLIGEGQFSRHLDDLMAEGGPIVREVVRLLRPPRPDAGMEGEAFGGC